MKKILFLLLCALLPMNMLAQYALDTTKVSIPATYNYIYKDTMLLGGAGHKLVTEMYLPEGEGPWPVVVLRSPYMAYEPQDMLPGAREFAKRGIGMIIQRCRGTYGSEGTYEPNINERADGLALLSWLQDQPWVKNIGLTGASYVALTCWIVADAVPEKVKGIYLHHYGVDRHLSAYASGLFRQDILTSWAIDNARELKQKPEVKDKTQPYYAEMRYMPQIEMDEKMLGARLPWYRDWISHTDYTDPYWYQGVWDTLRSIPPRIHVPMTIVAGHFDHHMEGTLLGYELLPPETKAQSRLIVGSWNHFYQITPDFGNQQHAHDIDLNVDLFNWMYSILVEGQVPRGEVKVYAIGADNWITTDRWPSDDAAQEETFYLSSKRNAADGKAYSLTSNAGTASAGKISYTYDPQNPVLSVGGETLFNSETRRGSQQQPAPGYRDDVITFLSDALSQPMTISGKIRVKLNFSSDCEDTSVAYKISEVMADGTAWNIRTGITTLAYRHDRLGSRGTYTPGEEVSLSFESLPIVWQLKPGSRIRVDITSSDFPQYSIHSNNPGVWSLQTTTKVARQTIFTKGSSITIPTTR